MILLLLADLDNAIAKDGKQILYIPEDLARFKRRTEGHILVMGRKTFEATGTLENRLSLVMTRSNYKDRDSVRFFHTEEELDAILADYPEKEVFLIGGAGAVERLFHRIDAAYITRVPLHTAGEKRIPDLNKRLKLISTEPITDKAVGEHWIKA